MTHIDVHRFKRFLQTAYLTVNEVNRSEEDIRDDRSSSQEMKKKKTRNDISTLTQSTQSDRHVVARCMSLDELFDTERSGQPEAADALGAATRSPPESSSRSQFHHGRDQRVRVPLTFLLAFHLSPVPYGLYGHPCNDTRDRMLLIVQP